MKTAIDVINYIESDCEIAIPIDRFFNEDGNSITKKEYGRILLEFLVVELRSKLSESPKPSTNNHQHL